MAAYYQLISRETTASGEQIAHYHPTQNAQGAWNEKEQHMAPATGVICAELECFQPREDMQIGRLSLDILGMIHLSDFTITTRLLRPGRTIELIESTFEANDRICIVARVWRLHVEDTTAVEGLEDRVIVQPNELPSWDKMQVLWGGGYIRSINKSIKIGDRRAGKGIAWLSNELAMVEGESTSGFVKLMGMVDTMNGLAVRQEEDEFNYMFPNLDLQIHLYRIPKGKWLGLDIQQQHGANGVGLTSAVLHDENGSFGHAEQILTVRPMLKRS